MKELKKENFSPWKVKVCLKENQTSFYLGDGGLRVEDEVAERPLEDPSELR